MEVSGVVLAAGRGSRMMDLSANYPKAILPVGNFPMIWYPLHFLERAGLEEAYVVVHENTKSKIEDCLATKCDLKIRIIFSVIPSNEDWGTADALRHIVTSRKFSPMRDVMVLSCDLVTDFALHRLLDVHRANNSSLTALFAPIPSELMSLPIPGQKAKAKFERDLVGIDPNTCRLLFMNSVSDFDDTVSIRASLLQKNSRILMKSNLLDGHFYIFSKWIIDYIVFETSISSIKGELIPLVVSKQFSQESTEMQPTNASIVGVTHKKDILQFAKSDHLVDLVNQLSLSTNTSEYYQVRKMKPAPIRCYAYIADGAFCMRANSVASFCELNRQVAKRSGVSVSGADRPLIIGRQTSMVQAKNQMGLDNLVGDATSIGENGSIKRSVIGYNCKIGDKVKITNCIILDYVKIGNGCTLQGSLIGNNAILGESCDLKDCLVASSEKIDSNSKLSNEMVSSLDHLMEVHM